MLCCCDHDSRRSRRRDSETIQHTLFECKAFVEDRNESLKRLYVIHPAARGLSDEGHCRLLTGDVLPCETENAINTGTFLLFQSSGWAAS